MKTKNPEIVPFCIERTVVKRSPGDYEIIYTVTIDQVVVAERSFLVSYPPLEPESRHPPRIEGVGYTEFLKRTKTRSRIEYGIFNGTNNLFSRHFGVRGWNYDPRKETLPPISFVEFLPEGGGA